MIGCRSTSPHPSLSSSGSEEVRCSLDELDAVIATFDEEARKHCQSLSRLRSDTPTLANSRVQRRGSLSLEDTFISGTADSLDYTSATLRNPRINRLDLAPVQATENFPTRNDASPLFVEDDFPPPPPDAFAPENFILPPPSPPPPPPPPLSPSLSPVLIRKQHGVPSTQLELITSINSSERNSQLLHSASAGHGDSLTTALVTKHSNGSRPISSGACRRPMVPQRAPSTRLSSVPITEELRPRSVAADSTVPVKETPGSVASSPNSHLKSASSNCVSSVVEKLAISVDEPTIDHMVPPVSDIIRHFDRRGQLIVGAACRPGFVPPKPISNGTREDSRVNTVPTSSNESNTTHSDRKVSMPINSFGLITPTQSQTSTGHESDLMSSPKMQQMMRGFTLSRSNSVETNRRAPSSLGLCSSPLVRTISPPVLSPTAVSVASPTRVPASPDPAVLIRKLLPPGASQLSSSKHLVPESRVCNGHSSSPSPLSSFRSVSRISTHGSTRHSPPLPSPPPPQHVMPSVTSVNRSNSINHRVNDLSDSETSSCHPVVSSQSVFPSSPPPPPTCTPPPPPPPPSPPSIPAPIPPMAVSPIGLATRVSGQVTDQAKTQLNPHVVHQQLANTLQQRRASAETRPTTEKPRIVSVHSMRLDPNTLETLIQFNIAEAHQIPGYQPVPPGLPDWKTQKLERKNRDAADAYAADLRKWGCIPQWKRELIEKRHHGKTDSTPARTSSVTNDSHPDLTQSLISVELTEKLQRRLEKVAAMAES